MEGKGKSKTITHAYIADGDARTRSHSGADQDQSVRAKTRHQFFEPRKDHDYLTRLVRDITALVPKEGEQAGSRPRGRKPEQDLITRPT